MRAWRAMTQANCMSDEPFGAHDALDARGEQGWL
jgi:hypothetical protein